MRAVLMERVRPRRKRTRRRKRRRTEMSGSSIDGKWEWDHTSYVQARTRWIKS